MQCENNRNWSDLKCEGNVRLITESQKLLKSGFRNIPPWMILNWYFCVSLIKENQDSVKTLEQNEKKDDIEYEDTNTNFLIPILLLPDGVNL